MYLIQSAKHEKGKFQEFQVFQVILIKISFLLSLIIHVIHSPLFLQQSTYNVSIKANILLAAYILLCQILGWCNYYAPNDKHRISKRSTIFWHTFLIFTTILYSLLLTNQNPSVHSHYFKTRIVIYSYCCTNLINNLHVVKHPVIYQKRLMSHLQQYWLWQVQHYQYPLYCIIFGFFLDFVSFGTYINMVLLAIIVGLTLFYKPIKYFFVVSGWQRLKHIFTSQ